MEVHGERDSVSVRSYTLLRIPVHRSIFPYTLIPKALCVCRVHYVSQCLDGIVIIISMPLPFDAIISLPPRTKKTYKHTRTNTTYAFIVYKKHTYRRWKRTNARKLKCLLAPFFVRCAQLCVLALSHSCQRLRSRTMFVACYAKPKLNRFRFV